MALVKAFRALCPKKELADKVAALPYDVYDRAEAKKKVKDKPLLFLNIDRPETQYGEDFDMYSDKAYETARDLLRKQVGEGIYEYSSKPMYYIYELTMDFRMQTGIVAVCSIDEYIAGKIKKHENTRKEKELDRIRHIDTLEAQTGPIFLTYKRDLAIKEIIEQAKEESPLYDFISDDGIRHRSWEISDAVRIEDIENAFKNIDALYIADGHHRAASAVNVGIKRRNENKNHRGDEEYNYFLSVLFQEDELRILPYNRYVKDLNGLDKEAFLKKVSERFYIEENQSGIYTPDEACSMGMYIDGVWYHIKIKEQYKSADPVDRLDVSLLQDNLLSDILGINDPRIDNRISFIGGIRGAAELERLVNQFGGVAFLMYPTQMEDLLRVADAGMLMPPKSTWFEPKLRSGLFIHEIN